MCKSIWSGEKVEDRDLMAYVIAKIASFAQVRVHMFSEDNIYTRPPIFIWRFTMDTDESVYQKLNNCVSDFQGQVKWAMYGSAITGDPGINYYIEPEFFRKIYKQHGYKKMPEILEAEYKEELRKAVEDVVPLAKYIEKEFGVVDSDPILPTDESALRDRQRKERKKIYNTSASKT